jgi:hypothetical protein
MASLVIQTYSNQHNQSLYEKIMARQNTGHQFELRSRVQVAEYRSILHTAPLLAASSSEFIDQIAHWYIAICCTQTFLLYPPPFVYTLSLFLTIAIESIIRIITLPINPVPLLSNPLHPPILSWSSKWFNQITSPPPVTSHQQVWEQESST